MTSAIKPVKRQTFSNFRGRPLIIEIHSTFVRLRQKGKRSSYTVTYDQLWTLGAKNQAAAERAEREAARKARRVAANA